MTGPSEISHRRAAGRCPSRPGAPAGTRDRSRSSEPTTGPAPTPTSCSETSTAPASRAGVGREPAPRRGPWPTDCVPSVSRPAGAGRRRGRGDSGGRRAGRGRRGGRPRLRRRDRHLGRASARSRRARALERELRDAALARGLPLCGPNGNGIFAVAARAPDVGRLGAAARARHRGDDLPERQPGRQRARLAARHPTTTPCFSTGNQAVLDASDWLDCRRPSARASDSVAMFLEEDGDGERFARLALANAPSAASASPS